MQILAGAGQFRSEWGQPALPRQEFLCLVSLLELWARRCRREPGNSVRSEAASEHLSLVWVDWACLPSSQAGLLPTLLCCPGDWFLVLFEDTCPALPWLLWPELLSAQS